MNDAIDLDGDHKVRILHWLKEQLIRKGKKERHTH